MSLFFFQTVSPRRDVRAKLSEYFDKYLTRNMEVYDVGCGAKPFGSLLKGKVKRHIGVDIEDGFYDASLIDLVGTAYDVPIPDGSADAIISSQVIEHLEYPAKALSESKRILRLGGYLFLSFPFLYPIHAEPADYNRLTEYGVARLLKDAGFDVIELHHIAGFWYLMGAMFSLYLQPVDKGIFKKIKVAYLILGFVRWLFMQLHNLEGLIIKVVGKNPENHRRKWTCNYVLVARKTKG